MLEAMYEIAQQPAAASDDPGIWFLACREIAAAISTLDAAGAFLVGLADSSDWQSAGLRALHELLERLRGETGVEVGHLTAREWELGRGGAA
ncbi:hypothetical protein CQ045_13875 [Microbacterium sp. MYb66]|nr:hypothetical protein CQ045_13875 [Microbacterium sp. MYb66]